MNHTPHESTKQTSPAILHGGKKSTFYYDVNGIDYIGMYASVELGYLADEETQELIALPPRSSLAKCSHCGETKPKTQFYKDLKFIDGVHERCKECVREYSRSTKGKKTSRIGRARRRSKRLSLPTTLTQKQWEHILNYYNHQCAYCGKSEEEAGTLTQDHVMPLSRGGGLTMMNIVPACRSCNSHKNDRTPTEAGLTLKRLPLEQIGLFE